MYLFVFIVEYIILLFCLGYCDYTWHIVHLHLCRRFYLMHSSYSFTFWSALAFPGNRTHDLGVASAMLYYLSYRKALKVQYWKVQARKVQYRNIEHPTEVYEFHRCTWWQHRFQNVSRLASYSLHRQLPSVSEPHKWPVAKLAALINSNINRYWVK